MGKPKKYNKYGQRQRGDFGVMPATVITQLAKDYGWGNAIQQGMNGNVMGAFNSVKIPGGIPGAIGDCIEVGILSSIYKATPKMKVNIMGFKIHN